MAYAAPIAAVVGAGASIFGAVTQAKGSAVQAEGAQYTGAATAAQQNYQAGVAEANAVLAKQDADYAQSAGEITTQQAGMQGQAVIGATKAGIGAGNIALGVGSAGRGVGSEVAIAQENEAVTAANTAKQVYGFKVAQAQDVAQAGAFRAGAKTAIVAGGYGAQAYGLQGEASIISGVGSTASKFAQMGQSFGLPGGGSVAPSFFGSSDPSLGIG